MASQAAPFLRVAHPDLQHDLLGRMAGLAGAFRHRRRHALRRRDTRVRTRHPAVFRRRLHARPDEPRNPCGRGPFLCGPEKPGTPPGRKASRSISTSWCSTARRSASSSHCWRRSRARSAAPQPGCDRGENARGSVSRVLSSAVARRRMCGHSSRRRIAPPLKQPTRATSGNTPMCRPYSVLLPVGFAVPPPLPVTRCALTAPFRPCRAEARCDCFLWHFPWGRPRRPLTGTVVPWSPDFPRLACASRGRPTLWPAYIVRPRSRSNSSWSRIARHSPSIVPSSSSGRKRRWKATVAAAGRARHSPSARARAGSRRRSSADRPGPGSGAAWRARGGRAAPSRTARPDPPCASGAMSEWPTTLAGAIL